MSLGGSVLNVEYTDLPVQAPPMVLQGNYWVVVAWAVEHIAVSSDRE